MKNPETFLMPNYIAAFHLKQILEDRAFCFGLGIVRLYYIMEEDDRH